MKIPTRGAVGCLLMFSASVHAVPVTHTFKAASLDFGRFEPEDYTFSVTYDPGTALDDVIQTTNDPYSKGRYFEIAGSVAKGGQTANVDSVVVQMSQNTWDDRWGFSIVYTIDPAPFNDTGSYLEDDDQNDGLIFTDRNGNPTSVDLNEIRFGFGVGDKSPHWDELPTDADGLPVLTQDLDFLQYAEFSNAQASLFGIGNRGSLFKVVLENDIGVQPLASTTSSSAVPVPATLWLFIVGLAGFAGVRRYRAGP